MSTSTPNLSTRQAVVADLDLLAPLFDQYRSFQGQPSDVPAARRFLAQRFDHGESVLYLAFDGEVPVGFAQLFPSFSSVALARVFILNDLFVAESARRLGVASRLLAAVEAHAWTFGACRVTLNVAIANERGQALYDAAGWQRDRHFHMYHRHPPAGG